jgi:hypothetical protein
MNLIIIACLAYKTYEMLLYLRKEKMTPSNLIIVVVDNDKDLIFISKI